MNQIINKKNKTLWAIMYGVVLFISLYPIIFLKHFPTMDGAAHIHNARLLLEMVKGNSFIQDFLSFNTSQTTNWTGHLVLAALISFLSAEFAVKLFLVILAALIPLSLYSVVVKDQNLTSVPVLMLSFPFIYNFLFLLGFWNYHLGIVIMFFIYAFLYKHIFEIKRISSLIVLFALVSVLYFTHAFVFAVFAVSYTVIFFYVLKRKINIQRRLYYLLKNLVIFSLPLFFLFRTFLIDSGSSAITGFEFMSFLETFSLLFHTRPLIYFNYTTESKVSIWYFFIFLILFSIALRTRIKAGQASEKYFKASDVFLGISVLFLMLTFLIPDAIKPIAGFIKNRTMIPGYLFFILWLSFQPFKKVHLLPLVIIGLLLHFWLVNYYTKTIRRNFIDEINKIQQIGGIIEPNSVVLPINKKVYWPKDHFSNYLGIKKPMIILENYEASTGSFPLKWYENVPDLYLGSKDIEGSCLHFVSPEDDKTNKVHIIDYVFIYNYNSDNPNRCLDEYDSTLKSQYLEINTHSDQFKLYKYKANE